MPRQGVEKSPGVHNGIDFVLNTLRKNWLPS